MRGGQTPGGAHGCTQAQAFQLAAFGRGRASDPAPQLVSLAPLNFETDHLHHLRAAAGPTTDHSDDYADYQTVTAFPAQVVDDTTSKKTCKLPS